MLKTLHRYYLRRLPTMYWLLFFWGQGKDQDHLRVEMKLGHHHFEMHFHPVSGRLHSVWVLWFLASFKNRYAANKEK